MSENKEAIKKIIEILTSTEPDRHKKRVFDDDYRG